MVPEVRLPPEEHAKRASKAVLFCSDCGYESPVDGDWVVWTRTTGGEHTVYACPVCGMVIQSRPQFENGAEVSP